MKQTTSYRFLNIPNKLRGELRLIIDSDKNPEYVSNGMNGKTTSITFYPMLTLTIIRPLSMDENGQRVQTPWNINDSLTLSKFNLPIFCKELKSIIKDMEIPELYTYHGNRLELNEKLAEKVRRVFMINTTTIELSPVVIIQDENRLEGIKMKFNNEQSTVLFTLNEITSLEYNIQKLDIDSLAMLLYINYINRPDKPKNFDKLMSLPVIDIAPKNTDFI